MERESGNLNSKKTWERMGERILAVSRQELYLSMRYLYLALERMPVRPDDRIQWIGTDGSFLYFQPMLTARAYEQDAVKVNRAYLHSVLHGLFAHMYRRQDRDVARWNLATDIAVESMIDGLTLRPVRKLVPEERERFYQRLVAETRVLSAERIYEVLGHPDLATELPRLEALFLVDDHCFWRGDEDKQSPREREQEEKERELWQETRERIQTEMETYARTAGMEKTRLYQEIGRENREKGDYREFLLKFSRLREEARLDLDSFDYGYYQYGMQLYGNMPLIEELEYREGKKVQELAVVIDTSGSCSKELVTRFLEETLEILTEAAGGGQAGAGNGRLRCHILQADNQVQDVVTVETTEELERYLDQWKIIGRGGTDFRPALAYVTEQKRSGVWKELQGVLYLTDGYGIYPERRPDFEVAFLFPEDNWPDGKPPWRTEEFPPWAFHLEMQMK